MPIRYLAIITATAVSVLAFGPANAQEPPVEGRHGLGTAWWQPTSTSKQKVVQHRKVRTTRERKPIQDGALPIVAQTYGDGGQLIAIARHYLGTNPTGWASLWCGRFMAMVAPEAARRIGNPNLARNWAKLPHTAPHVGAIAVLSRGPRGGHVGVVTGFDRAGNPIIISGNHGRRVAVGTYPKSRVVAYVRA